MSNKRRTKKNIVYSSESDSNSTEAYNSEDEYESSTKSRYESGSKSASDSTSKSASRSASKSASDSASEFESESSSEFESESDSDSGEDRNTIESGSDSESDSESNSANEYEPEEDVDKEIDTDGEPGSDVEESTEEDIGEDLGDEVDIDDDVGNDDYVGESKVCYMKNLDKEFMVLDEDDSNMYGKMEYKKILNDNRISDPIMTYYEIVRIIGTRAQQFNFGAAPLIKGIDHLHPAKMAYTELMTKMTPFIIRRHLPGKKYEEWRIDELEIIHEISDSFFVPENLDWNSLMKQIGKPQKILKKTNTKK